MTQSQHTAADIPAPGDIKWGDPDSYHWILTLAVGNGQSFRSGTIPASAVTTRDGAFMRIVRDVIDGMGLPEDAPYAVLFFDIQPNRLPATAGAEGA